MHCKLHCTIHCQKHCKTQRVKYNGKCTVRCIVKCIVNCNVKYHVKCNAKSKPMHKNPNGGRVTVDTPLPLQKNTQKNIKNKRFCFNNKKEQQNKGSSSRSGHLEQFRFVFEMKQQDSPKNSKLKFVHHNPTPSLSFHTISPDPRHLSPGLALGWCDQWI